jgi:hypothetical protein
VPAGTGAKYFDFSRNEAVFHEYPRPSTGFPQNASRLTIKTPAILVVLPDSGPETKTFPFKLTETGDNRQ